jgi:hypothetical protein
MTPDYTQERWQTPVSDARSLAMVSLLDRDGLHITLEDLRDPVRRRFKFVFRRVAAYRNILEEYRTTEPPLSRGAGWTVTLPNSPWLAELRAEQSLLDVHSPGCRHYVIVTEDDIIDILCPEPPEIVEVEPAKADEDPPGKSRVLYHSEDKDRIARIVEDITKRKPDV